MKKIGVMIFLIIPILVGTVACNGISSFNDHTEQITITDKERVNESNSSKYLIMGRDEDSNTVVYENTDCLIRGKFDSSTFYADMEVGKTYEVTLIGFRVPYFSWYENILSYKKIKN